MSKIAVIETGGKQYVVKEDDIISVEKIGGEKNPGSKLTFDKVLLVDDGKAAKVGTPHISGVKVEAELMENGLGKKVNVIRFKSKSRYFKKKGHRQPYTKVKITKIN
jgi:large subunit ribosomal protein L21